MRLEIKAEKIEQVAHKEPLLCALAAAFVIVEVTLILMIQLLTLFGIV